MLTPAVHGVAHMVKPNTSGPGPASGGFLCPSPAHMGKVFQLWGQGAASQLPLGGWAKHQLDHGAGGGIPFAPTQQGRLGLVRPWAGWGKTPKVPPTPCGQLPGCWDWGLFHLLPPVGASQTAQGTEGESPWLHSRQTRAQGLCATPWGWTGCT